MRVKNYLLTAAVAVSMTASPVLGPLTAWAGSAPLTSEAIRTGAPAQNGAASQNDRLYPEKKHAGLNYSELSYTGCDFQAIRDLLDRFSAAAGSGQASDPAGAVSLYSQILDAYDEAATQYALLQIKYYTDVSNEEYSSQMEEAELGLNEISDQILLTFKNALDGPCGDALRAGMSDLHLETITGYEAMTDRELELTAEEIRLVQQYDQAMMEDCEITYNGEAWTEDKLEETPPEDDSDANTILTLILKKRSETVVPILKKLVSVRTEIARENGYDNYVDYAYEELYNRDFTPGEVRALYPVIKDEISPLYMQAQLLFYTMESDDEALNQLTPGEEILNTIEPYIGQVHPALTEAFDYMREHHLYDIEKSDTKMSMGFTTALYSTGDAFIYNQPYGYYQDYWTMIHEFGHYNAAYHAAERCLYEPATLDVAEIHSQGLEVLFFDYMDDMFGENGKVLEMSSVTNMLYAITDGFKYDEFQQTVYSNPDMTADEINELARRLEMEYSGLGTLGMDEVFEDADLYLYTWIMVNHTFQSPLYYISYATSAMSALDIWGESLSDRASAVEKYMALTAMGFNSSYKEALRESGLRDMLDAENIEALSSEIYTAIKEISSESGDIPDEFSGGQTAGEGNAPEPDDEAAADGQDREATAGQAGNPDGLDPAAYAGIAAVLILCIAAGLVWKKRNKEE